MARIGGGPFRTFWLPSLNRLFAVRCVAMTQCPVYGWIGPVVNVPTTIIGQTCVENLRSVARIAYEYVPRARNACRWIPSPRALQENNMWQCEDGHEEVVYERMTCPACDALEQLKEMTEERDEFQKECDQKIVELQKQVDELEAADYARRA